MRIEMISGRADDDDKARALDAAEAVFTAANVSPAEAYAEFMCQWLATDTRETMHGLALVWIDAESAADIALTKGWHNPNGASCTITV